MVRAEKHVQSPVVPHRLPPMDGLGLVVAPRTGAQQTVRVGDPLEGFGSLRIDVRPSSPSAPFAGADEPLVAGDFVDVFDVPNGSVAVAWGDTTSAALEAGSPAMLTMCLLRALAAHRPADPRVAAELDLAVRTLLPSRRLLLVYGIWDPATRRLRFCNFGCRPPVLLTRGRSRRVGTAGPALGMRSATLPEVHEVTMMPGQLLIGTTRPNDDASEDVPAKHRHTGVLRRGRRQGSVTLRRSRNAGVNVEQLVLTSTTVVLVGRAGDVEAGRR